MRSEAQLEILWRGSVRGLDEHRVSLGEFGHALNQLLIAARRITSQIVSSAHEPAKVGRLANAARFLDIELVGVKEGSAGFESLLVLNAPAQQESLFGTLVEQVGLELVESIRLEAQGEHRNVAVRRYLELLPIGLEQQTYRLRNGSSTLKSVELGVMSLPSMAPSSPSLMQVVGNVVGVGFAPGTAEVRVKGDGSSFSGVASERQIERALALRGETVFALAVAADGETRLVSLQTAAERQARRDRAVADIFHKWQSAFEALA